MKYFFISLSSEKADVFDHPRSIRCLGCSQKSYEPILAFITLGDR